MLKGKIAPMWAQEMIGKTITYPNSNNGNKRVTVLVLDVDVVDFCGIDDLRIWGYTAEMAERHRVYPTEVTGVFVGTMDMANGCQLEIETEQTPIVWDLPIAK